MIRQLHIAVPVIANEEWPGGVYYVINLLKALHQFPEHRRPKTYLLVNADYVECLHLHAQELPQIDGVIFKGVQEPGPTISARKIFVRTADELFKIVDFVFPLLSHAAATLPGYPAVSWIPDFQHRHLPQLFTEEDRRGRDVSFAAIAKHAKIAVLSSESAHNDWKRQFPDSECIVRILHFFTAPAADWYATDPVAMRDKYALPERYLICCNQFWVHKDHLTLVRAVAKLREAGYDDVRLVCTGSTSDYRARDYLRQLQGLIGELGVSEQIQILGFIPRLDQIALLRGAMAAVQPSLFEGWSSVVEDSRLLGKTLFLSDIDVHQEQAPAHGVYFRQRDPEHLAELIAARLDTLAPGPNLEREDQARADSLERVARCGKQLCEIALESQYIFGRHLPGLSERLNDLLHHPLGDVNPSA